MKKIISILLILFVSSDMMAQTAPSKQTEMKMNAGIVTRKLTESKAFYIKILGFELVFENDFYLLLNSPGGQSSLSFLLPNHPSQQPLFHKPFQGQGVYLTIEVPNADKLYEEIKKKGVKIKIELRDEPWGDRHFAIEDPNGIGIDLVTYKEPEKK